MTEDEFKRAMKKATEKEQRKEVKESLLINTQKERSEAFSHDRSQER